MFKTTSNIQHLVNNPYIYQIWIQEGIFTLKLKGYQSLAVIKETFNLSDIKPIKPHIDREPDKENPLCDEFVMRNKSSAYGKAVELVNSFINFAKFNKDKVHKEFYSYGGVEKCMHAINRYFEPHESKEFNKQLLEIVPINENDKLILLQDAPKRKDSGALGKLKEYIKFWGFDIDLPIWKINSKGVAQLDNTQYLRWLELRGFRSYFVNEHQSERIRIINNKATKYSRDMILNYLEEELRAEGSTAYKIFKDSPNKFVFEDLLKTLPKVGNIGIKSDRFTSYHAFINGVVMVTSQTFKLLPYHELPFTLWESEIIKRHIDINVDIELLKNSMFARFFNKAMGKENVHIFGYLCHKHKDSSLGRMVVLTDNKPTDNAQEANGGTGKGIILRALSLFNHACFLSDFNGDNRFSLDGVNESHDLIIIPDAQYDFNFRALFSAISETMVIQRKFQASLVIDFKDSPKLVCATNHKIKLDSESYNRRVIPIHFSTFFNNYDNTPAKYLGGMLFEGDYNEWNEFDLFCIFAVQQWLKIYSFDSVEKAIMKRLSEWVKPSNQIKKSEFESNMKNIPTDIYNRYLTENGLKEVLISKYTQGNKPITMSWEKVKY